MNMGGDITVNGMKALTSEYIGKYLDKNPQFKKKIEDWLGKYIANNLEEIDNFEFLKKYVEESIGLVIANIKNLANFFYEQFINILPLPTNPPQQPSTPPYTKA